MNELKGFPPKIFIIGAQKSGTTQLSELLNQHPQVCLSEPKESDFFSRYYSKGLDWYKSLFSQTELYLIDASTSYTSRPLPEVFAQDRDNQNDPLIGIPQRIYNIVPEARLIYIVRDPVKRAYSGYWHQVRAGHESRPLEKAIKDDSSYLRISKYASQLDHYLAFFPQQQILVLEFDDLIRKPKEIVAKCTAFLGLPECETLQTELHKNQSFQFVGGLSKVNSNTARWGGLSGLIKLLLPLIPKPMVNFLKERLTKPVPKMTNTQAEIIGEYFDDEITTVKDRLKRDD